MHLQVDKTVTPHAAAPGRIPQLKKKRIKAIVETWSYRPFRYTEWNSRMIIATKNSSDIHICSEARMVSFTN